MKAMKAELEKTRYRKIWLGIVTVMGVQLVWCIWIFTKADDSMLACGYYYGLMELCIMNTLFLPVVLAVAASRIWDTEHKGGTWKLLETLETKDTIYRCKFILGAIYCLMIMVMQFFMLMVLSHIFHFGQALPMEHLLWFAVSGFMVSLAVYLIQQILSMHFENQIIPLVIGLLGAFGGLFSNFFPESIQKLIVWGYYSVLCSVGMDWKKETRTITLFERHRNVGFLLFVILLTVILYQGGKRLFVRKEF